jgi:hypothetical protein
MVASELFHFTYTHPHHVNTQFFTINFHHTTLNTFAPLEVTSIDQFHSTVKVHAEIETAVESIVIL